MTQTETTIEKQTESIASKNQTIVYDCEGQGDEIAIFEKEAIISYIIGQHHPHFEVARMPDGITLNRVEDGVRDDTRELVEEGGLFTSVEDGQISVEVNFAAYGSEIR